MVEHVAARALELFQYAQPALDRGADLEPDAAGECPPQGLACLQHTARSLDLGLHEGSPGLVAALPGDVLLGDPVAPHFILGQVSEMTRNRDQAIGAYRGFLARASQRDARRADVEQRLADFGGP